MLAGEPRDAEIGELRRRRRGVLRDDHVLRLDIAVHDAALVGVLERRGQRRADLEQLAVGHAAGAVELGQRAALDELGHQIVRARVFAAVEQRNDRRVLQARRRPPLALDPRLLLGIVVAAGNPLDRDELPALLVARDPDRPVPTRPDLLEQPVTAQYDIGARVGAGAPAGGGPRARKRLHGRAFAVAAHAPALRCAMM